jgi:hypothetical protein
VVLCFRKKNPRPKDVALIRPQRGLMKIVGHPRVFLEKWNDGVMEYWKKGLYTAHLQQTMIASKATISLFPEITTPLLHCSINAPITFRQNQFTLTTPIEEPAMRGKTWFYLIE